MARAPPSSPSVREGDPSAPRPGETDWSTAAAGLIKGLISTVGLTRAPSNTKPTAISRIHIDSPRAGAEQGEAVSGVCRRQRTSLREQSRPHGPAGQGWNEVDPASWTARPPLRLGIGAAGTGLPQGALDSSGPLQTADRRQLIGRDRFAPQGETASPAALSPGRG